MTVRIVTDSSCDLPQSLADELGIEIVPLTIRFGTDEFVDRRDLTPEQFWARCKNSAVLPETAAPAPGLFEAAYRKLASAGATGIVAVMLSGDLSATMQSAELAARAVAAEIPVVVVDSRTVTMGLGMMAVSGARMGRDGATIEAVATEMRALAERTKVFGALDTLENLKKGGRIGNARALVASVLSIKPIIEVRNGKVEEAGKQRTRAKALAFLASKVREQGRVANLAVVHGAVAADARQVADGLADLVDNPIVISDMGAVIGAHAGQGVIGVVFQTLA